MKRGRSNVRHAPAPAGAARRFIWTALAVCFALACAAALRLLQGGGDTPPSGQREQAAASAGPSSSSPEALGGLVVVPEDRGVVERRAPRRVLEAPAALPSERLRQDELRTRVGETINVKFPAPRRSDLSPIPGETIAARGFNGRDPAFELAVQPRMDGGFDVPFRPRGPGQFRVALTADGAPVASQLVSVVGASGGTAAQDDRASLLSVDPREPRARTSGRTRRR